MNTTLEMPRTRRPAFHKPPAPAPTRIKTPKPLEDPYQGFSKEDYEEINEIIALDKAGKIKWVKHDLIDA